MTMAEFRANEELVTWAHKLMTHRNWKILMDTMIDEHPMHNGVGVSFASEHTDSKRLGYIEGYNAYAKMLGTAKDQVVIEKEVPTTYAAPED